MFLWNKIIKSISGTENHSAVSVYRDTSRYAFVDVEVGMKDHKIHDIGALK